MKITNKTQVDKFVAAIEKCKDDAYLLDTQGNQYHLKSVMSRHVALGKLLDVEGDSLELFCENKSDEQYFMQFFRENPTVLRPRLAS